MNRSKRFSWTLGDIEVVEPVIDLLEFHMQGKHDQKMHGNEEGEQEIKVSFKGKKVFIDDGGVRKDVTDAYSAMKSMGMDISEKGIIESYLREKGYREAEQKAKEERQALGIKTIYDTFNQYQNEEYEVPDTSAHKLYKGYNYGAWGASHGESYAITGQSASVMGIDGYNISKYHSGVNEKTIAIGMLREIANDKVGAEEVLFHGFQNINNTEFNVGDTMKLPLTATAGSADGAVGYGFAGDAEYQKGKPTVFVFEKGVPMVAYNKWNKSDSKEFGHVYSEAITAGEFKVTKVETYLEDKSWQFFTDENGKRDARHLDVDFVFLEHVSTFNPDTGKWQ